jgi:hypothetical protein
VNTGRRELRNPEIITNLSKRKISFFERSFYLDATILNKEAIRLDRLILEEKIRFSGDKEKKNLQRAYLLINSGLRDAKPVSEGRFILFGFAFQNGSRFYLASQDFIKQESIALGKNEKRYVSLAVRGSNLNKRKIIKINTPLELDAWDRVNFPDIMKVMHES